jgi:hypothetical protein
MRPLFPGMDPWLEHPAMWPDVHNSLIAAIRDALAPLVRPRYFVGVESRTTLLSGLDVDLVYRPDVSVHATQERAPEKRGPGVAVLEPPEVKPVPVVVALEEEIEETYLLIKELPGRKLVTVIEILSPSNKKGAEPRLEYRKQRSHLIRALINLVEIDLLRVGEPMPLVNPPPPSDYRILICRPGRRMGTELYPFSWRTPIPPIPIPLLPGDTEPILDLNTILHALMDRARYDLVVDYAQPPDPSLRPEDAAWAATIVAAANGEMRERSAGKGDAP